MSLCLYQGKPTEATQEVEPLEYGASGARDFLPGAEVLKDADQLAADGPDGQGRESTELVFEKLESV